MQTSINLLLTTLFGFGFYYIGMFLSYFFKLNKIIHKMTVQTTEQKKEEFRKYLEKAGVIDQLTKVLVGLYEEPEKPGNVIEFIKKSLGAPSDTDVEQLMAENEELKRQKSDLEKKIEQVQSELDAEKAKQ